MPLEDLRVMDIVRQHHHAARRIHHVVIEVLRQPVPQLQRVVIEPRTFVIEIVGADDGGVAAGVAAAEPALLDHCDIGDAVLLGQVIGGPQAVSAGADDDDIIVLARLRRRPLRGPALVAAEPLAGDSKSGIFAHGDVAPDGSRVNPYKQEQIQLLCIGYFATLRTAINVARVTRHGYTRPPPQTKRVLTQ
jgi:hypothetical protein